MITWTVLGRPINVNKLAARLIFHPQGQLLLRDIGEVIEDSFRLDKEGEDIPDGICLNCGEDKVTHADSLCDNCVQEGWGQCRCCNVQIDLTYLFQKHNFKPVHKE